MVEKINQTNRFLAHSVYIFSLPPSDKARLVLVCLVYMCVWGDKNCFPGKILRDYRLQTSSSKINEKRLLLLQHEVQDARRDVHEEMEHSFDPRVVSLLG